MTLHVTPELREFREIAQELQEGFGYNQNNLAEACMVSAAMVSLIMKGERSPSPRAVELLRRKLAELKSPHLRDAPLPHAKLIEQLTYLEKNSPAQYEAARAMIDTFYKLAVREAKARPGVTAGPSLAGKSAAAVGYNALEGEGKIGKVTPRKK